MEVFSLHRKLTNFDGISPYRVECWQKLTEDLLAARKIDGSWWKVYKPLKMLTENDGSSPGRTESDEVDGRFSGNVGSWRQFMKGPTITWELTNVDGRSTDHKYSWQNLTECLPTAQNVDGNWRKVSWPQWKLTEGHGRPHYCTESYRWPTWSVAGPLPSTQNSWWELMECLPAIQKVDASWRKVIWWHRKLMEVDRKSPGRTESWQKVTWRHRKLTKSDRISSCRTENLQSCWKASWPHGKMAKGLLTARKVDSSWRKVTECPNVSWKVATRPLPVHRKCC